MSDTKKQKIDFRLFECSKRKYGKHLVKAPIPLSCGDFICKTCIPKDARERIKCDNCDKYNEYDLVKGIESSSLNYMIESHLNDLYNQFETKLNEVLINMKDSMNEAKERIDLQFDFLRDLIETRIESIKIELDNLFKKTSKELTDKKADFIKRIDNYETEIDLGKNMLKKLQHDCRISNQTVAKLYNYEDTILKLTQLNENMKNLDTTIEFNPCKTEIVFDTIGKIKYKDPLFIQLKSGVYNSFDISISPLDSCYIGNNYLGVIDRLSTDFCFFDKYFNQIDRIKSFRNQVPFKPYSITSNLVDKIFMTDYKNHKIVSTDFELNIIKKTGCFGTSANGFDKPLGICYDRGSIYICDSNNERIKVYDEDLKHSKSHDLYFEPRFIQIIENTACIRDNESCIYFYDLTSFQQQWKYDKHSGVICTINNLYFCEFDLKERNLLFYDKDGSFNFKIQLLLLDNLEFDQYDFITYFNNSFVISSNKNNKLVVI